MADSDGDADMLSRLRAFEDRRSAGGHPLGGGFGASRKRVRYEDEDAFAESERECLTFSIQASSNPIQSQ